MLVHVVGAEASADAVAAFPVVFEAPAVATTKASVASFVVPSAVVWVVPVVPLGSAGVPERFAAVPVVFWFQVGTEPVSLE